MVPAFCPCQVLSPQSRAVWFSPMWLIAEMRKKETERGECFSPNPQPSAWIKIDFFDLFKRFQQTWHEFICSELLWLSLGVLSPNLEVLCMICMLLWVSWVHLCSFQMLDFWTTLAADPELLAGSWMHWLFVWFVWGLRSFKNKPWNRKDLLWSYWFS